MGAENALKAGAARVQTVLENLGLLVTVRQMPATTRTAQDAASAIGCTPGQIVKSLIFRGSESGKAYLILCERPQSRQRSDIRCARGRVHSTGDAGLCQRLHRVLNRRRAAIRTSGSARHMDG